VIQTNVSDFKTYMHNYKTEFGSNYVYIHTECNITSFERPYNHEFLTNLICICCNNVYYESTFIPTGLLTCAFQYI